MTSAATLRRAARLARREACGEFTGVDASGLVVRLDTAPLRTPQDVVARTREQGFDAKRLEELVDHRSGLAGISCLGGDMRTLHAAAAASNADAALAIRMFCDAVRKQLAAMWAVLDGADAIVFTGGIGEHDEAVRAEICTKLSSPGVQLDAARHRALRGPISSAGSSCRVQVLPSLEDEQIARHTGSMVQASGVAPFASKGD